MKRVFFIICVMAYCMLTACSSDENNDSANGELVVEMDENQTLITSSLPHAFWQSVELYSLLEGASIYSDKQIDETLTSRWDWVHEEWGYAVRREMNRILQVKKVMLDAPRMSKL